MNDGIRPFDRAMTRAVLDEFYDIPDREEDIPLAFSPEFELSARQLLGKTRRNGWRYVGTTVKRVLVAAIVAVFMVTSALAYGPIYKLVNEGKYLFNMTPSENDVYHEFYFDSEIASAAPDRIEEVYFPAYVPESFFEEHCHAFTDLASAAWGTVTGERISYRQSTIFDNPDWREAILYDAEEDISDIILLGDYEVLRIKGSSGIRYLWSDHRYYYQLHANAGVEEETLQKIFESIELMPDEEIFEH